MPTTENQGFIKGELRALLKHYALVSSRAARSHAAVPYPTFLCSLPPHPQRRSSDPEAGGLIGLVSCHILSESFKMSYVLSHSHCRVLVDHLGMCPVPWGLRWWLICNIEVTEYKDGKRCCSFTCLLLTQLLPTAWGRQDRKGRSPVTLRVRLEWAHRTTPCIWKTFKLEIVSSDRTIGLAGVRPVLVEPRGTELQALFLIM